MLSRTDGVLVKRHRAAAVAGLSLDNQNKRSLLILNDRNNQLIVRRLE